MKIAMESPTLLAQEIRTKEELAEILWKVGIAKEQSHSLYNIVQGGYIEVTLRAPYGDLQAKLWR